MAIPGHKIARGRKTISQTPTITAGAYSANDAVGGKLTFAGAAIAGAQTGAIRAVVLQDKAKQAIAADLVLFNADFTPTADNAAFAPSTTDLAKIIGVIPLPSANYSSFNANGVQTVQCDLPFELAEGSTAIYGQLVTRGTPTYAATSDLTIALVVEQD